jgi:hypothetical protein
MLTTTTEVKKALLAAGFELYRTRGQEVCLADRVRDNLIMDSGVSVLCRGSELAVRLIVRAQRADFPAEAAAVLFGRARTMAAAAESRGFREVSTMTTPVQDPVDGTRTLDTWYEVTFEKQVGGIEEVVVEVRAVLALDKTACSEPPGT